ncbi:MAG: HAMP domain-containing histidine kinase [Bernardetiaceae bacterium]|nr:HAMP domain-containing histidine kinase [Bernardetiaceae bacterium]
MKQRITQKTIAVIVGSMTFALCGLIGLQFYWINTSLALNKERFTDNVHKALEKVSQKLEKNEIIKHYAKSGGYPSRFGTLPHSNRQLYTPDLIDPRQHLPLRFTNPNKRIEEPLDLIIQTIPDSYRGKSMLMHLLSKCSTLEGVAEELSVYEKPIAERVSYKQLDSLLHVSMQEVGIKAKFRFLVFDKNNDEILFAQNPAERKEIFESEYNARLFPNDLRNNNHYLYLYFPTESKYLVSKMWGVLLASIAFIGIIIFCFWKAIETILSQKRISEVTNDFINNMTHEFKTPISTISLASELLQDPSVASLPSASARYLGMIKAESKRLHAQVDKVLQVARLDRSDFKLKIQPLDLHHIIENAIQNIFIQVEKRGGKVQLSLDAERTDIQADEVHITNIISNLVDNANKYSPEKPEISIRTESLKNGILVSVADNGLGISKKMKDKVFDKFYRIPTGDLHDVKGFGLGLSYVKTMVEAHGGNITLDSELGKGSTFKIFMPYTYKGLLQE